MIFKPKISKLLIALNVSFIIFGIVFTFLATKDGLTIRNLFPLIWVFYGIVLLLKISSTKYQLINDRLQVIDVFNKREIIYDNINKVEKRKINFLFRHGSKGRIRSETCSDTIFITSSKPIANQKYTIIISPNDRELFIELLSSRVKENNDIHIN